MNKNIRSSLVLAIEELEKDNHSGLVNCIGKGEFVAVVRDNKRNLYVVIDHLTPMEKYDYALYSNHAKALYADFCNEPAINKEWH